MNHNDDAYATMLLTMALSPNREEYARPYGAQEFARLREAIRTAGLRGPGRLLGVDIGSLMAWLNLTEEEGYRAFTLLNRTVQLSYALEGFIREGIEVVTPYDPLYPERLTRRLGDGAPAFLYCAGDAALLQRPAIAILGISGVKTTAEVRENVERLVALAAELNYAVFTGGELGVARIAAAASESRNVPVAEILGGGLRARIQEPEAAGRVAAGGLAASLEHPDAMFTAAHAAARNRVLLALASAAFVFNSDGKRGEAEAVQGRICDWVYAWDGHPGSRALASRGAAPFHDVARLDLASLSRNWTSSQSEQISFFDLL